MPVMLRSSWRKNQRKRYDAEICGSAIPSAGGYADPGQLLPIDQKDLESYPPLLAQFLLPDAHKTDAA